LQARSDAETHRRSEQNIAGSSSSGSNQATTTSSNNNKSKGGEEVALDDLISAIRTGKAFSSAPKRQRRPGNAPGPGAENIPPVAEETLGSIAKDRRRSRAGSSSRKGGLAS